MKKLVFAAIISLSLLGSNAQAQQKLGHINMEDLIGAMPEYQTAMKEMQELQASLEKQGQELNDEAEQKQEQFLKDSSTYSAAMKEIKREELLKLIQRLNNYSNEAQDKIKQVNQQKMAPIYQKAIESLKAVAKEGNYAYVMDSNSLLVSPPSEDLLALVKKKMGIKDAPAAPAAGTPATKKP